MDTELDRFFFRETVRDSGTGEGEVVRQRGGIGVYAHVRVSVHALARGQGTVFAWNAGLNIPAKFAAAVSQGVHDVMRTGVLAGLELTDIRASVESGSYHDVDSTADAFREAAERATTDAIRQARPMILEALSAVSVTAPSKLLNGVEKIFASHGEKVMRRSSEGTTALVPTRLVAHMVEDLLRISEGQAEILSTPAGFRPRLEPPDKADPWFAYT